MPVETSREIEVTVRNVGGIEETTVPFDQGVTVFVGENATNRTSLFTALNAALGGSMANLKTDADDGGVVLEIDGNKHTRWFERENGRVSTSGTPYTDESVLVDDYVTLLEQNPIRRVVQTDGDIRDALMGPIDTDDIDSRLRELLGERNRLDTQINRAKTEASNLSAHQSKHSEVEAELDEVEADLEAVEADIEDVEATEAELDEAEALRDRLDDLRDDLADVDEKLDHHRTEHDSVQEDIDALEDEEFDIPPEEEVDGLEDQRRQVRDEMSALDTEISVLESVVEAAQRASSEDLDVFVRDADESVVSELDPQSIEMDCPLCGSTVTREDVTEHVETLAGVIEDRREQRQTLRGRIEELDDDIDDLKGQRQDYRQHERRLSNLRERRDHHEREVESFKERRNTLQADIEAVEAEIPEMDDDESGTLSELYSRRSELDYRRGRLESELADIEEAIESARAADELVDDLDADREEIIEEMSALRTKVEDIDQGLIDQFNDHMERLLDILGYENLARVWMERKAPDEAGPDEASFDLHIVREDEDGVVYEDTIDTLSESEREVIGLVVALAGYLVHEVHEEVPFMLLDSLEAIDAKRISALVEYFSEHADNLVLSLLPEDGDALAVDAQEIGAAVLR
jgi:predicted  nucleic acid-binding Zn-ribbon protein